MFEMNFKIKLDMYPYDFEGDEHTIDDVGADNVNILWIHGDYDWFDENDDDDESEYAQMRRECCLREHGFTDDEVCMTAKFVDGVFVVNIVCDGERDEMRHCSRGERTLVDCIKYYLNGALSDGIGENEIGRCDYDFKKYDIWFGDIFDTDEDTEDGRYFKIV